MKNSWKISLKLFFFDHLSFNKKKQKANCGDKQKEI